MKEFQNLSMSCTILDQNTAWKYDKSVRTLGSSPVIQGKNNT